MRRLFFAIVCMGVGCLKGQVPPRYGLLIHELFPDPEPSMGLPGSSFIELRNVSRSAVDLKGFQLQVNTTTVKISSSKTIKPDSLLILCATSAAPSFRSFGDVLGVSGFPALPDAGGLVALYTPDHRTMHAVLYDRSWQANDIKREGGWSLEMMDINKPCMGKGNWTSSRDPSGGTPGRFNSVAGQVDDEGPPHALRSWTQDSTHIMVLFDQTMDSASSSQTDAYNLTGTHTLNSASAQAPLFQSVLLELTHPLTSDQAPVLSITSVTDCPGNMIAADASVRVGLPIDSAAKDIVINEVLFNPKPSGTDYVELFNKGKLVADAHDLSIARRNAQGALTNMVPCSPIPFLIFPGDHYVLSENPDIITGQYLVRHPETLSPPVNLPSMPDDEGSIVLLDRQGMAVDELHYFSSWHFPLLDDVTGVSLERVDPAAPTQMPSNWHSAAADIGYGTPTSRNSQHRDADSVVGSWTASPEVFSPDLDGYDDLLTLSYKFPGPGWSTSVTIFDREGRPIRWLCRNMLCGNEGQLRWDGLDEAQKHPGWGAYIVVAESITGDGRRSVWRKRISIAGSRR